MKTKEELAENHATLIHGNPLVNEDAILDRHECVQDFLVGFNAGFQRAIDLLKAKIAMGYELDAGMRCGDTRMIADWLEENKPGRHEKENR